MSTDELSSEMRNSIMVFVFKFVAILCVPLAGFFVHILSVTEDNIQIKVGTEILKLESTYRSNFAEIEILKKEMDAYEVDSNERVLRIIVEKVSALRTEIVTKKHVADIKKSLEARMLRNYSALRSNFRSLNAKITGTAVEPNLKTAKQSDRKRRIIESLDKNLTDRLRVLVPLSKTKGVAPIKRSGSKAMMPQR